MTSSQNDYLEYLKIKTLEKNLILQTLTEDNNVSICLHYQK